jgi:hypothetical protein
MKVQKVGWLGMLCLLISGGVALVSLRLMPAIELGAVVLAATVATAVVIIEPRIYNESVVYDFDARLGLKAFRTRHLRDTLLASVAMGLLVLASATIGMTIDKALGLLANHSFAVQAAIGTATGVTWLGLTMVAYAALRVSGHLRITPVLPDGDLRLAGQEWRQVLSVSVQSAVGEESLFRLLGITVLWWLTGQPLIAIVATALLWAITHDGGELTPRWGRMVELTIFGCILGTLLILYGIVSVLVAHFVYNLVLLSAPLLNWKSKTNPRSLRESYAE